MTAANTDPIYSKQGDQSNNNSTGANQPITAAANDYTGVSANNSLVFTAGAQGAFIQRLRLKAAGTNTASVMRFYLNNGAAHTSATNNVFFGEISLPGTTATIIAATVDLDYPVNFAIPAGWTIWAGLGTAVAAGWVVTPISGQY